MVPMNKVKITIKDGVPSLLDTLRSEGYFLPAYCGGRASCGKCRVRIAEGAPPPTEEDYRFLSREEISEGWRLACRIREPGEWEVELPAYSEEEIVAAGIFSHDGACSDRACLNMTCLNTGCTPEISAGDQACALAVDIGTTTLAACLVRQGTGEEKNPEPLRTVTGINHQRVFGADVVSRINAASREKGGELQRIIKEDLDGLCRKLGLAEKIQDLKMPVIISGNTTMQHLLQGLSCRTLGLYPFDPVDISLHNYENMTILPGISTFVGADIVSGIVACGIDREEKISVYVDLGTNGEMAIGNRDRILATSTAAGPVFEGACIRCGTAGIPGAIESVKIIDGRAEVSTIGDLPPTGICGTGVLETLYALRQAGIVDETGLLSDQYFDEGFPLAEGIRFTQGDIRETQYAKAAIRAGIEILLSSYGVSWDQVDRLYLAGGFGRKIDVEKAMGIGLLPEELKSRVTAVGNASLAGAALYAADPSSAERFIHVKEIAGEFHLADHKDFQDLYVNYMFL